MCSKTALKLWHCTEWLPLICPFLGRSVEHTPLQSFGSSRCAQLDGQLVLSTLLGDWIGEFHQAPNDSTGPCQIDFASSRAILYHEVRRKYTNLKSFERNWFFRRSGTHGRKAIKASTTYKMPRLHWRKSHIGSLKVLTHKNCATGAKEEGPLLIPFLNPPVSE